MSDNTQLNAGSGGDMIRDIAKTVNGGVKTQVVLIDLGGGTDGSPETVVSGGAMPVTLAGGGSAGTPTQTSVSVGTSSALLLAASAATSFLKVSVPLNAANGIWVRWDNGVATQAPAAEYIAPGASASWVKSTGFLPTSQINAIASAAVAVTLIYN